MYRYQSGLSLVELMVAMAVAIVLMAIGVPMYQGLTASNRAATQTNALVTALNLARSEAVKRGVSVSLCGVAAANVSAARPPCTGDDDWTGGWMVFTDLEDPPNGALGAGDDPIRVWAAFEPAPTIDTDSATFVSFLSNGGALAGEDIEMSQDGSNGSARCIHILASGQIRSEKAGC